MISVMPMLLRQGAREFRSVEAVTLTYHHFIYFTEEGETIAVTELLKP